MNRVGLLLALLCASCSNMSSQRLSVDEISSPNATGLTKAGKAYLVDVRSSDERLAGEVPASVHIQFGPAHWGRGHIPVNEADSFLQRFKSTFPDKSLPFILFCNSCVRSREAAKFLVQNGYTNVMTVRDCFYGNRFGEGLHAQLLKE